MYSEVAIFIKRVDVADVENGIARSNLGLVTVGAYLDGVDYVGPFVGDKTNGTDRDEVLGRAVGYVTRKYPAIKVTVYYEGGLK